MPQTVGSGERVLRGIPVSTGVCRGRILVLSHPQNNVVPHHELPAADVPDQLQRLQQALINTRREIQEVQRQVSQGLGAQDASIFDAHLLVLDDPMLLDEVTRFIHERRVTAEYAFQQTAEKFARTLGAIHDEYLRERATDMRDVTSRVLNHLLGRTEEGVLHRLKEPCIIIAPDLTPTQT